MWVGWIPRDSETFPFNGQTVSLCHHGLMASGFTESSKQLQHAVVTKTKLFFVQLSEGKADDGAKTIPLYGRSS